MNPIQHEEISNEIIESSFKLPSLLEVLDALLLSRGPQQFFDLRRPLVLLEGEPRRGQENLDHLINGEKRES